MLLTALALAAVAFGLLVAALATGSVMWAWGSAVVCVAGVVMLVRGALAWRHAASGAYDTVQIRYGPVRAHDTVQIPYAASGRHSAAPGLLNSRPVPTLRGARHSGRHAKR